MKKKEQQQARHIWNTLGLPQLQKHKSKSKLMKIWEEKDGKKQSEVVQFDRGGKHFLR